jgi:hypothetical protein
VALDLILLRRFFLVAVTAAAAALLSPAYDTATNGYRLAKDKLPHREWSELWHEAPKVVIFVLVSVVFAAMEIHVRFSNFDSLLGPILIA